jgi:hypothetical protein
MQKQQTVTTSLGNLTVSSLTLGDLRNLDSAIAANSSQEQGKNISSLLRTLPVIVSSLRKAHPELTKEQLEAGITLEDFTALFKAVLEVSGLKQAEPGEPIPVPV